MCGIAGILHLDEDPASSVILRKMTDVLAHRGPDGEGVSVDGAVGLGHRRLAIIDLTSAGHQPMQTSDKRYTISYNGEVYNFRELRAELEVQGYQFRSQTDSEVVLNAWAAWGPKALDRFNGMFAFAIWDRQERELILARDRYGIKPLYYIELPRAFLFGSEVKALLVHPAMHAAMDCEGLLEYMTFQNFFADRTLFAGVRLLPAGTWLRRNVQRCRHEIHRYWDYNFHEPAERVSLEDYAEELDRLFLQAVRRQLVSDVPVGAYRSGGDELFGGYPWRYYRAVVNDDFEHYIDKYYGYWQRLIPNTVIRDVFQPIWSKVDKVWTRDIFRDVFNHHVSSLTRPEDYINHSLYFEAKTFLHGLLVVEDNTRMPHGLENRVPFLDNDLVDFAMRLPVSAKLGNLGEVVRLNENEPGSKTRSYFEKTRDGKLLLRKVMQRYVPAEITDGIKQGFSAPDASWFKGESIDYVRRRLLQRDAAIYSFLDRETVQGLVSEHLDGKANCRLLIWSLLSVEQWCETFLNPEISDHRRQR